MEVKIISSRVSTLIRCFVSDLSVTNIPVEKFLKCIADKYCKYLLLFDQFNLFPIVFGIPNVRLVQ